MRAWGHGSHSENTEKAIEIEEEEKAPAGDPKGT